MGFENCLPRVFSADSIERNAPSASGVYGISNSHTWLFVGESENIKESLLAHLKGSVTRRPGEDPTGFSFELSPFHARVARQNSLIGKLSPTRQGNTTRQRMR